jgi:hypothetical protein
MRTIPALIGLAAMAWLVVAVAGPGAGRADQITFRGGGQIRGKVVADPQHPDRVKVLTETGKTPLSFQKGQIVRVQAEPSALDEYVVQRDSAASTAEAQYELGLWCEQHKLKDLAELHFEAALRKDKTYEPAHQKLGHVWLGNRWIWGDELREAQGLVRYKGQWISKEEKDQREAAAASNAEQTGWIRRLKLIRQALLYGPEERRRDAQQQLVEIRDPVAVSPLLQVFGGEAAALRMLLDHALERIDGPEAAAGLVRHILRETDSDVRQVALEALKARADSNIVPNLVKGLGSTDPAIVNRAAWTLSNLDAVTTVPKLIPALITVQYQIVMPPVGGSVPGNLGVSFGSVAPTPGLGGAPFVSGGSYGVLTPPVVGPGAVAYGAAAIPVPTLPSAGLSLGGSNASGPRSQIPRIVPLTFQNVEVLAALIKLTGRDFGFNIPAWKHWVATEFHPDPTPARRVPQP